MTLSSWSVNLYILLLFLVIGLFNGSQRDRIIIIASLYISYILGVLSVLSI